MWGRPPFGKLSGQALDRPAERSEAASWQLAGKIKHYRWFQTLEVRRPDKLLQCPFLFIHL
jgi:hypothetical protein